jgi:hypothetical protein
LPIRNYERLLQQKSGSDRLWLCSDPVLQNITASLFGKSVLVTPLPTHLDQQEVQPEMSYLHAQGSQSDIVLSKG